MQRAPLAVTWGRAPRRLSQRREAGIDAKAGQGTSHEGDLLIPATVRLGVTGHRVLADAGRLQASVREVLARLDQFFQHTPHAFSLLSPLAEGSDRLVAHEVLAWPATASGFRSTLDVVLPLAEADYLRDFQTQPSRDEFRALVAQARSVRTLAPAAPRTAAYEQIGRYVVDNCDVLVAIWDGKPARGQGGTAQIVAYARSAGRSVFRIEAESGRVTPERLAAHNLGAAGELDAYNRERLNPLEARQTADSQYGFLSERAAAAGLALSFLEPLWQGLLPHFARVDRLADRYQKYYKVAGTLIYVLAAAAVAVVTLHILFLPDLPQVLWLEALAMVCVVSVLVVSHRGDWHRKWIDYRFLAERLRAALFLNVAGIDCGPPQASPPPFLSHKSDEWMVTAFASIWARRSRRPCAADLPFEPLKAFLLGAWIRAQAQWFEKKGLRHRRLHRRLDWAGLGLFALTVVVAGVHAAEVGLPATRATISLPHVLTFLAIVLPAVGAALAGIRAHREYLRNSERYAAMVRVLGELDDQIDSAQDWPSLADLLERANEVMLRENQDWRVVFLYQKLRV